MTRALLGRLRVPGGLLVLLLTFASQAKESEAPRFLCEPNCECDATMRSDCRACIWVTASFVPESYPVRFVAQIKDGDRWRDKDIVYGRSGAVAIENEWTLVTMEVRVKGAWKPLCRKLFKRRCANCELQHADYKEHP